MVSNWLSKLYITTFSHSLPCNSVIYTATLANKTSNIKSYIKIYVDCAFIRLYTPGRSRYLTEKTAPGVRAAEGTPHTRPQDMQRRCEQGWLRPGRELITAVVDS